MNNDNTFYQLGVDEFGQLDNIETLYPRNPFDDDGADNIFGLGNKQKKAERKLAKAEKKLAKGNVKAAERKISKANKLLGKVQSGITANQPAINSALAASQAITNATNPAQTESMQTDAGQIGAAAQPPTLLPQSSLGGGSGGGDMTDTGYSDTGETSAISGTTPEDLSTPDNPIVLPTATVTAGGKKNNMVIIIIIAAVVIIAGYFLMKKGNKKLLK